MEGCEGGNKKFKDDGKVREGRSFSSLLISLPIVDVLVIRSIKYIYIYIHPRRRKRPPPPVRIFILARTESLAIRVKFERPTPLHPLFLFNCAISAPRLLFVRVAKTLQGFSDF